MRNSTLVSDIPHPLRITDDWEERHIVLEDIKSDLDLSHIDEAREYFAQLQADWQTLDVESQDYSPDPHFLSAWQEHRRCFQYLLRSELVYQLKRAIGRRPSFSLESNFRYLLIDEYQDLNRCDLAVIRSLAEAGLEVYAAGDDDQSIYGFRKAHPDGIRNFPNEYGPAEELLLRICRRCPEEILTVAEFVANQDRRRLPKDLQPAEGSGSVTMSAYSDQDHEARAVAERCARLISQGTEPGQILILLRSDRYNAFSRVIQQALMNVGVPVSEGTSPSIVDGNDGRQVLAFLRLVHQPTDSLAWRTLIQLRRNGIGDIGRSALRTLAVNRNWSYFGAITQTAADPALIPRQGGAIATEYSYVSSALNRIQGDQEREDYTLTDLIDSALELVFANREQGTEVADFLLEIAGQADVDDLNGLFAAMDTARDDVEQRVDENCVNILSMHQAKGLTADAVFIPACEDEYLPGRQEAEPGLSDERRLLYVSMTRARRYLHISFCENRFGRQQHSGRNPDSSHRDLTRFLRDGPLQPE